MLAKPASHIEEKLNFRRKTTRHAFVLNAKRNGFTCFRDGPHGIKMPLLMKEFEDIQGDMTNFFVDNEGNYCVVYDDYHTLLPENAPGHLQIYERLFAKIGKHFTVEYCPIEPNCRDPPFLDCSCHRDGCIIVRIPDGKKN